MKKLLNKILNPDKDWSFHEPEKSCQAEMIMSQTTKDEHGKIVLINSDNVLVLGEKDKDKDETHF